MDRNGNGMLDPDETEGRARGFIERIAQNVPGVDFNRPISIDKLAQSMDRMRQEGGWGRGGWGGGPGGPEGASPGAPGASSAPEPLVPGFGVDLQLAPVPGFGTEIALPPVKVKIEDVDRKTADDRIKRYDRNADGLLTKDEIEGGRWSDDPYQYDRNKDGKLTIEEMAMRYATRRAAEATQARTQNGQGASGPGNRSTTAASAQKFYVPSSASSSTGSGSQGARPGTNGNTGESANRIVDFVLQRYDRNGSGALEKDEWSGMRSDPSGGDKNGDGKIDRGELAAYLESRSFGRGGGSSDGGGGFGGGGFGGFPSPGGFGGGESGFGGRSGFGGEISGVRDRGERGDRGGGGGEPRSFGGGPGGPPAGNPPAGDPNANGNPFAGMSSYRPPTAAERLEQSGTAKDLPEWFLGLDRDHDTQVAMNEYSKSWSDDVIAEFFKFDANRDGMITVTECLEAVKAGSVRGGSASGGGESQPGPDASRSAAAPSDGSSGSANSGAPSTETPKGPSDPSSRYVAYAVGVIKKYDKNGDGMLDASEWSAMKTNPSMYDADKDGKLTPAEFAKSLVKK